MPFNATMRVPYPKVPASKTESLRRRIDELTSQGLFTAERREQLKELLVRIDLSSNSPFGEELCPKHWRSVTENLDAARRDTILLPAVDEELRTIVSLLQETEVSWSRPLTVAVCQICARSHTLKVRHLSFARPDAWFYLSPADARKRCEGDENFLSIDRKRFFIRGTLPVQVEEQAINIQIWAEVEDNCFAQFIDSLLAGAEQRKSNQPPLRFKGILANRLLPAAEHTGEAVDIECNAYSIPKFWLTNSTAPLWSAQNGKMNSHVMSMLFSPFAHSQALQEELMSASPKLRLVR